MEAGLTSNTAPSEIPQQPEALGRPIDILVNNAGIPPDYFRGGRGLHPFLESARVGDRNMAIYAAGWITGQVYGVNGGYSYGL